VPEVREELRHGHPVITLVKLRELPDHLGSPSQVDHYVVVVGVDGDDLLINDPASSIGGGHRRPIAPAQLERAWAASSVPGHALAVAGGAGVPELELPDPVVEEVGWLVTFVPADAGDRREAAARRRAARESADAVPGVFPGDGEPSPVEYAGQPPPICFLTAPRLQCSPVGAT